MTGAHARLGRLASRASLVSVSLVGITCVPPAPALAPAAPQVPANVRELPSRPSVAVVARDGDPRAAFAVAVLTAGVDDAAGPRVPVALAAVTEARLTAQGIRDVTVSATWDGYRVRALLPPNGDGAALVRAVREALLTPIAAGASSDVRAVERKLSSFARHALRDPTLLEAARCTDEPLSLDHGETVNASPEALEKWRAASDGLGRVVFGVAGTAREVDAVASAILAQPVWPAAAPFVRVAASSAGAPEPLRVYDATTDLGASVARVTLVVHTPEAGSAVAAARTLGAKNGALSVRLRALDAPVTLREITGTAGADGGCIGVVVDVPHAESRAEGNALATVVTVLRQEARQDVATASRPTVARARASQAALSAGDPREAAELAAWWALIDTTSPRAGGAVSDSVFVGMAAGTDPPADVGARAKMLEAEVLRTASAWQSPVLETRREVEPGQGAMELLLASPCGTLAEGDVDAGLDALAIASLVEQARSRAREQDAEVSEWLTSDGVGVLVRATRHDGETPGDLARRAADTVGEALLAETVEASAIGRARAELMALGAQDDSRSFATLAEALVPGHPSWSFPLTMGRGLEAWSDGAVVARIAALRHGPMRLAILGTEDAAQVDLVALAVDRWMPRSVGVAATCPPIAAAPLAKPGTYAAPPSVSPSAWLAIPLPRGPGTTPQSRSATRDAALATAAALEGPDGLLARALSSGLAYSWSARVIGPVDAPALVVHVASAGPALDAAVAQVRGLLDRLRRGGLTEADRTRAISRLEEGDLGASLSPRGRVERLWRSEPRSKPVPPLDALRTFLAETLHDDALIIVASRPPLAKVAP